MTTIGRFCILTLEAFYVALVEREKDLRVLFPGHKGQFEKSGQKHGSPPGL